MGYAKDRGFGGKPSRGSGVYVQWTNGKEVAAWLDEIEDGLKYETNRQIRQEAKAIGNEIVIPHLKRAARSAQTRQARAMAETARAKADRIVVVQIGGVNPPLSGFKRGRGVKRAAGKTRESGTPGVTRDATSLSYRTTLAWGSEFGPWPGGRALKRDGTRGAPVNHYKAPRRESGHWVQPGMNNALPAARGRWVEYVRSLILQRSKYR